MGLEWILDGPEKGLQISVGWSCVGAMVVWLTELFVCRVAAEMVCFGGFTALDDT